MELDPVEADQVARRWDEQHLELAAAGHQIGAAVAAGFSASVAGSAQRFATGWGRVATSLGETCESRADSMRTAVRLALEADGLAGRVLDAVLSAVAERR
jgi:cellulase/cellobiase CelA1